MSSIWLLINLYPKEIFAFYFRVLAVLAVRCRLALTNNYFSQVCATQALPQDLCLGMEK